MNGTTNFMTMTLTSVYQDLVSLNIRQQAFLGALIATMVGLSLYWGEGALGIAAGITGVTCVFLVNMRKISNYFWGFLNVVLYGYLAFQAKYYGDTMLNWGFYLPIQFIGAYMWCSSMVDGNMISRKLSLGAAAAATVGAAVTAFIYSIFLNKLGGSLSFADATTTVLSIIATFLMVKGYREQWVVWIAVNIISIFMWWSVFAETGSNGIGVLIMWVMFLVNAIYGTYTWYEASKPEKALRIGL